MQEKNPNESSTFYTRKPGGFTLIELLIVVAIIAILAAIAVPNFLEAQVRSRVARASADMRSIATAMEMLRMDVNCLPFDFWDDDIQPEANRRSMEKFGIPCIQNQRGGTTGILVPLTTPIAYMSSIPVDTFSEHVRDDALYPGLIPSDWLGPRTFVYIDNDSSWNDAPCGLENGVWMIISAGPNGKYGGYGPHTIVYDPTNGTRSSGDLTYNSKTGFEPYR